MRQKFFFIIAILLIPVAVYAAFPKAIGFVNDFANVLNTDTRDGLERLLSSFEKATGIEVAVAILPSLEGHPVEDVAVRLFQQWGIGKKGKDNGILFLIAPNDRSARIEVGYGLEGAINDALAGRILDSAVIPYFKSKDMASGIIAGTNTIIQTIVDKEGLSFNVDNLQIVKRGALHQITILPLALKIIGFIFLAYLFIRHPWLFLLLLSSSGRGGGGGFSGGFGGFGGGLSGGGGSSRGW